MHMHTDKYAYLDTWLHRWDPRVKLASTFILLIAFACANCFASLAVISGISFAFLLMSRIPPAYLLRALAYPLAMLAMLSALLTVTSGGETLFYLWKIPFFKNGLCFSIVIIVRSLSQLLLVFVILETTPFTHVIEAMYLLKVPEKLVAMAFFTFRFIYVYLEQMRKMRIAAQLRGGGKKAGLSSSAGMIGSLLIRSFEQADRINCAMALRAYSGKFPARHRFQCIASDWGKAAATLLVAILVVGVNIFL